MRPGLRRMLWFIVLWAPGVGALAAVVAFIRVFL